MPNLIAKLILDDSWRIPLGTFPKAPSRPLRIDEIPPALLRPAHIKRLDEI